MPSNLHGSSFERSDEDGVLYVTFNLKERVRNQSINRFLWYLKESKAGFGDTISGKVTYLVFMDLNTMDTQDVRMQISEQFSSVKQVRVDGCQYQLSETQIRSWLERYGVI
jgi:hypothetical protein